ncbi:MAG: hypothetical protein HOH04_07450 [Rhodospirillaceae bacterium]|jgi:hypothetical protein|nr:hypothetical protein [Rhodospirillaceae bacterium]
MSRAKRPRDPNQLAKLVVNIATNQQKDGDIETDTSAQSQGGKRGGAARAASLTPEQREDNARLAAEARWKKD